MTAREPERHEADDDAVWADLVSRLEHTASEPLPEPERTEEEDPEKFIPPVPPPLGVGEPLVVMAWVCVVGAPLFLLLSSMFWRGIPFAWAAGVIAVFVAAVVFLVFRLPTHRDEDDDGAQV